MLSPQFGTRVWPKLRTTTSKWFISQELLLQSCHLSSEIYSSAFPAADPIGTRCSRTPRAHTAAQQIPPAVQHPLMVPPIQRFITFAGGLKSNSSARLPQPCKAFMLGLFATAMAFFLSLTEPKLSFTAVFPDGWSYDGWHWECQQILHHPSSKAEGGAAFCLLHMAVGGGKLTWAAFTKPSWLDLWPMGHLQEKSITVTDVGAQEGPSRMEHLAL